MIDTKNFTKNLKANDESYVFTFVCKKDDHTFDEQDRKHLRIMAILQIAQDRETLDNIMRHKFSESFKVDKETKTVYYKIRIIKERRKYRGDC